MLRNFIFFGLIALFLNKKSAPSLDWVETLVVGVVIFLSNRR
jgi:hypothetical protein